MSLDTMNMVAQLTLDQTQFAQGMRLSQRQMETLAQVARTSGSQTDAALQQAGRQAGLSADRVRELQDYLQRAGRAGQDTGQALRRMEVPADANRDLQRLARSLGNVEQAAQQAEREMDGIGRNAGQQGESAGSDLGGGIEGGMMGKLKGLGGKGGPIAMALVGVATVGLAAGAALASAIADGMQQIQEQANIQAKFGLDADTMKRVGRAAGDSYKAAFGESVSGQSEIIAQGIQQGFLSMKSTNSEMTKFANQIDTVNQILGGETESTMMAINSMVKSGLVPNAETAMDLIVKAAQGNHQMVDDLTDSLKEYSSGWVQTGFSGEFALGLISQSMEKGSDNTDRASDAIREFGRRLYEETDTIEETLDGLDGLGESTDSLMTKFKKGGPEAEQAFDTVFDAIRKIEDPLERANAAQALLGDTAGDFINVFTQWDPSEAIKKMEDWEGATQNAAEIMGGTGQASLTSAMRSMEVAGNQVKVALAEAFGPTLEKVAAWVSAHQGEIIQFFTNLGVAALDLTIGVAKFASGTLSTLSDWYGKIAPIIGGALGLFGGFAEKVGGILKHIPGMEDAGKQVEDAGKATQWYADRVKEMPDALAAAKAGIDSIIPGLENARDGLKEGGTAAANTAKLMTALGDATVSLPDGHTITIDSNQPEMVAKLQALGLQVEELPDGNFKITANTAEGQQIVNDFVTNNSNKKIPINVEPYMDPAVMARIEAGIKDASVRANASPFSPESGYVHYAEGTADHSREPGISNKAILWGEAGPEAYIPLSGSKRGRSTNLLAKVADMFGYGLMKMADGGITDEEKARMGGGTVNTSLWTAIKANVPGARLTSAKTDHDDDGGYHPKGMAIDVAPDSSTLAYLWSIRDQLGQIIYDDATHPWYNVNGERAEGAKARAIYTETTMKQHGDHIHAMALREIAKPSSAGTGTKTPRTGKQGVVDKIVAVGKKMGMSDADIQTAIATGLVESELTDVQGGDRDSDGVFQQRPSMGWGSADDTIEKDAEDFFKELQKTDPSLSAGDRAQAVQKSAYPDKYAARMDEAGSLLADSLSYSGGSGAPSSDTLSALGTDAKATAGTGGGSVQDVRVTNWPSKIADSPGTDTGTTTEGNPKARLGLAFYADGAMLGPGDGMRVWNEPEAEGESYIPHASGKRGRATSILAQTAAKFGYQLVPNGAQFFAEGGFGAGGGGQLAAFGGYSNHADDYNWGPHGFGDLLALGFGGAMSVASMFSHIPGMLSSGELDLGALSGSGMDTSANSMPGFDQLLSKLDEMVTSIKSGKSGVTIEYAEINDPTKLIEQAAEAFRREAGLSLPTFQLGG